MDIEKAEDDHDRAIQALQRAVAGSEPEQDVLTELLTSRIADLARQVGCDPEAGSIICTEYLNGVQEAAVEDLIDKTIVEQLRAAYSDIAVQSNSAAETVEMFRAYVNWNVSVASARAGFPLVYEPGEERES